jgi:hypothetical protein
MAEEISNGTVPFESHEAAQYYGVKGWLLWFCVTLTIINPLLNLPSLAKGLERTANFANTNPRLHFFVLVKNGLVAMFLFSGIAVGYWLWTVRPRALHHAQMYLLAWLILIPTLLIFPFISGRSGDARQLYFQQSLKDFAHSLPYPIVWLLYLAKSRRVAATYSAES